MLEILKFKPSDSERKKLINNFKGDPENKFNDEEPSDNTEQIGD